MPFLDHLEELRWRILYSLLAIVVGTLVGWFVVQRVDVIGLLKAPIAPLVPGGRLMFTSPTEPFFITLKFAFALGRSEEHTSELQSQSNLVCRLLLEKKKKKNNNN